MNTDTLIQLEKLNKLELTETERGYIAAFTDFTDAEINKLSACDTTNVAVMPSLSELENVFRKDVSEKLFSREDLLKDAPAHMDGYWQVPRLLD